ncbi:hypothetical protein SAMN06296036_12746 [Pseudobacteriovorax antillogorgiicola]|uniref:Outer membrane protein beta-barrel domain-containing protein n=2 Tax=Pseudobacteriovorax antillogorgiicola TaxID=1513793 RepID=A0A1Y6CKH9_9BACT|nr:hypothetical protein EDD56_12747 [Pseudobacteriovorax antillogorgiicola]SMF72928.1 hypothetical protein SAMN06296036_12746 [Pseudobacteriovorax antillogorgiicola]
MNSMIIMFLFLIMSQNSFGSISIGLSGATSTSNYSLETQKSSIISGNISLAIASFLRIGLTHRRSFVEKSGLRKEATDTSTLYYEFEDNTDIVTNSIDLTAILYHGRVSPFVFGGVARRDYFTEVRYPGSTTKFRETLKAVPNYGLGIAIHLNRHFRLKITQTYTPGVRVDLVDGQEVKEDVNDTYTQIGVNYAL